MPYTTLSHIPSKDRKHYIPYLLMADEAEMIPAYLTKGELYAILSSEEEIIGVALFIAIDHETVELKNFALIPEVRGKGIGKDVVTSFFIRFKDKNFKKMIVGTANCSIENIAFYQKAGFRMERVEKGFFLKYPEPIFENGIQAMDMIVFEREL
ncbi:GNAT family N-acetyltransferase [Alkalicoccobacillus porphyridii]|uniref:GNAT family N-acetyltransferase n=1 Tax=Alkalicoccobacillus porphyridii TaxID=2597270 RepID=A0A554A220_9BACI|nr:GNAT family N-acetyltransferase [Alkalicoccobacillus porphyridii]TSB47738.1 GNAT family N-acetyltransferase [Alkalicoccobacillus porphyridii]